MELPYILIDNSDLKEIEKEVNALIERGYLPQLMVVVPAVPGATSRNRYVVPMVNWIYSDIAAGRVEDIEEE